MDAYDRAAADPTRVMDIACALPPDIGPNVQLAESLSLAEACCETKLFATPLAAQAMLLESLRILRLYRVVWIEQLAGHTRCQVGGPMPFDCAQAIVDLHHAEADLSGLPKRAWLIEAQPG